ncbi:hypothetical protein DFH06DRAFT_308434 [Mycena polygramma]|nr:hypothetical protein DFH06DRAFT_308434 [Mycena polygramma]
MNSTMPLLDSIQAEPLAYVAPPSPFLTYAVDSVKLLRVAAVRIAADPACRDTTLEAVSTYFVASCRPKLRTRINKFLSIYNSFEKLQMWTPTESHIPPSSIQIESEITIEFFEKVGLSPTTTSSFLFDATTATKWWRVLLDSISLLANVTSNSEIQAGIVAEASVHLHSFMHKIPKQFWALQSLDDYIMQAHRLEQQPYLYEDDDGVPWDDTQDDFLTVAAKRYPYSASFRRMADALSSWTTGPHFLLHGKLAKASATLELSVIDLPRAPIPAVDADALLNRWAEQATSAEKTDAPLFSDKLIEIVRQVIPNDSPGKQGACHCEAGLMASMAARLGSAVTSDDDTREPAALAEVFTAQVSPYSVSILF